jgi:hypothetical protein
MEKIDTYTRGFKINTHTRGFKITCKKGISKKDYIDLCEKISDELNILHKLQGDEKIIIKPEPITEGGMVFTGNNIFSNYKSLRHPFCNQKWPLIENQTYDEWKISNEILFPEKFSTQVVLKSFYDSPSWSLEELKIFKNCFEMYDIKCTNMPSKKSLISF